MTRAELRREAKEEKKAKTATYCYTEEQLKGKFMEYSTGWRHDVAEKAFLYMLAIPLNVLFDEYWDDSMKERAPEFVEGVISLFTSVQDGVVSEQELADFLYDQAGVRIEADWLKKKRLNVEL